jgi:hypothetical protein
MSNIERRLEALAEKINALHGKVEVALRAGLEHARNAGELLLQVRDQCDHGEWLPWLRDHVQFSERTAQAYMRVARRWGELVEAKAQGLADLTFEDGLKLLAAPGPAESIPVRYVPGPPKPPRTVTVELRTGEGPKSIDASTLEVVDLSVQDGVKLEAAARHGVAWLARHGVARPGEVHCIANAAAGVERVGDLPGESIRTLAEQARAVWKNDPRPGGPGEAGPTRSSGRTGSSRARTW